MTYLLKRKLLHLFFPTRCPVCGGYIGAMERFCGECAKKLTRYEDSFSIEGAESFTAAFVYDDKVKSAVFLLKDGICGNAGYALGGELADRLNAEGIVKDIDVIVPAPMHRRDVRRRGFNQSAIIAKELGRILNIPTDNKSVTKTRHTHTQKGLGKVGRAVNLRSAFAASDDLRGKRVLLVDDICTTGSTLREITAAIKKAGAASVRCACCCKTNSHKN
ncbi:MAG: ComF family protein [Ruminococcus sp.]|uniref:ComF family protein n=1 Tax=Ruminococcus sp. TaxID=41978 RepID=UPI0025E35E30|nr:ComF family protein [Ruminococcus sp.]MBR5681869.1 ComF family protein [Ruminococcus sp.]